MRTPSIQENLTRLFKTQKYSLPLNPNFGLSYEWIDKPFNKELELSIIQEIREQIQLYEPRLSIASIEVVKSDSTLEIHINTDLRITL